MYKVSNSMETYFRL